MPLCPDPQKTEQKKENVPDLSALNSTIVSWPGFKTALILNSGIEIPCFTSMLLIFNFTVSPLLTLI